MEVADEFLVSLVELSALVVVQAEEGRLCCRLIDFHWFIEPRQVGVQHGTEANVASLCPLLQQPVSRIDVARAELRGRGLARSRFNSIWNPLMNNGLSKFTKVHRGNHLFDQLVFRLGVFSAVNNGVVATSFSIG